MFDANAIDRRHFLGAAAFTLAATEVSLTGPVWAQGAPAAFGPVKQIAAGALDVGYVDLGPANGPCVILLHGWPYDIHSFAEVAPRLAAAGRRVIVPYLRGYGTTRFLSADTPRNGQQAALAIDIIALMDALKIEKALVAGFDWGARTANILAALYPARVSAMVSASGYLIGSQISPHRAARRVMPNIAATSRA
jgi:pimeloyl-ACP methyl ester carboxylesterase